MKKFVAILLAALLLIFSSLLFSCSSNNAEVTTSHGSTGGQNIRSRQKYEPSYDRNKTFLDYLETAEAKEKTEEKKFPYIMKMSCCLITI